MTNTIDLNADLGEGDDYDESLLQVVSSCNIACGGHAGDAASMRRTILAALRNGVAVGAHPGYPDRAGKGRRQGFMAGAALAAELATQLDRILAVADAEGATIGHVKAHGALYNEAANDAALADVIAAAAAALPGPPALVGQPDSALQAAAREHGLRFVAEAFVDRAYRPDGRLVPRGQPGAVLDDPEAINAQALALATTGRVRCATGETIAVAAETLCLHGDTPRADRIARAVRDFLEARGVVIHACTS